MSLVEDVQNAAIDSLIATSRKEWIPYSEITDVKPSHIENVYYATRKKTYYGDEIMLLLLGSSEECTPTLVGEFARVYAPKYNKYDNNFRRYKRWLIYRNLWIKGFTKYDGSYYMVADKRFYDFYSRYGFCSACGILRCSPVWCICGHKQLSDGWTSNNKQL